MPISCERNASEEIRLLDHVVKLAWLDFFQVVEEGEL